MIKKLFISKVRVKMLKQFLFNKDDEYHVRGLVRIMEEEINAVRRELQNLESIGILESQRKGNKLFYKIDQSSMILTELTELLYKDRDDIQKIRKNLLKITGIKIGVITDNYLKENYNKDIDIDLLIVGEVNLNEVTTVLKKIERLLDRSLRATVMKQRDLSFQQKKRDIFLLNILQNDKIVLVGSINDLY